MEYPAASLALLDGLEAVTGISIEALGLRQDVLEQRSRLDRMVAEKPEHEAMVSQLEELYDLASDSDSESDTETNQVSNDVDVLEWRSGDELEAEIQEFFRDQP